MTSKLFTAEWRVPLADKSYLVQFDHGTTSGKRIILVDGVVVHKEDFKFKLVGTEHFKVGQVNCSLDIHPTSNIGYIYTLKVNGKSLDDFIDCQLKNLKCWIVHLDKAKHKIILEKDSMDIHIDGQQIETTGEFTDCGTSTHFHVGDHSAVIETVSSGDKFHGMIHKLFIDHVYMDDVTLDQI